MNKHTPGPWWRPGVQTIRGGRDDRLIARVDAGGSIKNSEVVANAYLIAAAPDLLEVVRDIVSDCEKVLNPGLYALAVAALAKAEGRE